MHAPKVSKFSQLVCIDSPGQRRPGERSSPRPAEPGGAAPVGASPAHASPARRGQNSIDTSIRLRATRIERTWCQEWRARPTTGCHTKSPRSLAAIGAPAACARPALRRVLISTVLQPGVGGATLRACSNVHTIRTQSMLECAHHGAAIGALLSLNWRIYGVVKLVPGTCQSSRKDKHSLASRRHYAAARAGADARTKTAQGWPEFWANFKALIAISGQSAVPRLAIRADPVQFFVTQDHETFSTTIKPPYSPTKGLITMQDLCSFRSRRTRSGSTSLWAGRCRPDRPRPAVRKGLILLLKTVTR